MQLDTLRKHFARSRYDQPIQVERPSEEVQPVQPPVRREDGVPVPVSSPARGPQSPALEGKRKPAR